MKTHKGRSEVWSVIDSEHIKGAPSFCPRLQLLWPWQIAVSRVPSPRQASLPICHWSQSCFYCYCRQKKVSL